MPYCRRCADLNLDCNEHARKGNEILREVQIDKVIRVVKEVWLSYPELRLGQLLDNTINNFLINKDLFYIEDLELLTLLECLRTKRDKSQNIRPRKSVRKESKKKP